MVDTEKIINKYISDDFLRNVYFTHVEMVKNKSLEVAKNLSDLNPDLVFIEEAAMLHDIGIVKVDMSHIHCFGEFSYLAHGYVGRDMLESEGLLKHALVCERHTGPGITKQEIIEKKLPLPERDMLPISLEEKIICLADNFYSKHPERLTEEIAWEKIVALQEKHGVESVERLKALAKELKLK